MLLIDWYCTHQVYTCFKSSRDKFRLRSWYSLVCHVWLQCRLTLSLSKWKIWGEEFNSYTVILGFRSRKVGKIFERQMARIKTFTMTCDHHRNGVGWIFYVEGHVFDFILDFATSENCIIMSLSIVLVNFRRLLFYVTKMPEHFFHSWISCICTHLILEIIRPTRNSSVAGSPLRLVRNCVSSGQATRVGKGMNACDSYILIMSDSFTKRKRKYNILNGSDPSMICLPIERFRCFKWIQTSAVALPHICCDHKLVLPIWH